MGIAEVEENMKPTDLLLFSILLHVKSHGRLE